MGSIHCCGGLRKSKSYCVAPEEGYLICEVDYLEHCPVCDHTVVQLTRINLDNEVSVCRKINKKAIKLFEKIKPLILYEKEAGWRKVKAFSRFYLNYSEYGVKKRCYSNLSTMKLGLYDW